MKERLTKYSNETSHKNGVCCTHFLSDECRALGGECAMAANGKKLHGSVLPPTRIRGAMMDALNSIGGGYTRLRELAEADRDGRLVVLPYRIDAAVYVLVKDEAVFYPETNGWYIGKETIGAITQNGFYLGDPEEGSFEPNDEIGKTVFLTCEEAEAALEAKRDG